MWVLGLYGVLGLVCLLAFVFLLSLRKTFSIAGKHVLVTGGSSGIGKSLAAEALKRGAAVVTLVARNETRLSDAKKELEGIISKGSEQRVCTVMGDVSKAEVGGVLTRAVEEIGRPVDVLINCAGITHTAALLDTPVTTYKELLDVNVLGGVYATKALLPAMVAQGSGAVVFISSQAGQLGLYGYTAYSTTKYALRGLAETLQMEVFPHKVQVHISFPPDTNTPQLQAEVPLRNQIATDLAAFGTVFEPGQIAREVWFGVERNVFQITHGLDGFLLGTATAGISPAHRLWDVTTQVLLMGVFRGVALVYRILFNKVVAKGMKTMNKVK